MTITRRALAVQPRRASVRDLPAITGTLARAFFGDPVFRWIYPDDARRREVLPGVFALFADSMHGHNEIHSAGDGRGAALWGLAGGPAVIEHEAEEPARRLEALSGADVERAFAIHELVETHHPPGPYHFLQFIGVEPESQGLGIGSALLGHMLERCDREGVRAYLDATSPHNKRLYERHGFRAGAPYAPDGGPPLWPMFRDPVA